MRYLGLSLSLLLFHGLLCAATLPPGFIEEQLVTGLDPTAMRMAPDGRLFVAEKNGRVLILENDVLLPDPFVRLEVDNFNERGLGGLAFHPDFEFNHYIYFFYTVPHENRNRVVRYTANGDFALPDSEEIIFELEPLPGSIHNGGSMHFGLDGKLYISVGDGGDANAANSLSSLAGKILRINDDGTIPTDNPFYQQTTGPHRAIWATGLRNSYSIAMHPETGQLMGCDVGGNLFEEVNHLRTGGYYGWPEVEGRQTDQAVPNNYRDPLYAYDHDEGCAVIGAAFYASTSPSFPPLYHDQFFFADYCEGFIKVMNPQTGEILETFATDIDRPLSLLVTPDGDFYYLERAGIGGGSMTDNTSTTNGSLWRVRYTGSGLPFISVQPEDRNLPVGEDAIFSVRALGAPTLTYQWQKDGVHIPGATMPEYRYPNVQLSDDGSLFRCVITNQEGSISSVAAELSVTSNTRPTLTLSRPVPGETYRAGDTLFFAGTAIDAEDGSLAPEQLSWFIDFHHDEHTHPALEGYGGAESGFFVIPQVGEVDDDVWYRVYLVAEDSEGLTQSTYREVYPEKTTFSVSTAPTGLRINVDGQRVTSPAVISSVIGIRRTLSAPHFQIVADTIYRFLGWEGTGNNNRLYGFIAGQQSSFTARYEPLPLFIGDGSGLLAEFFNGNADNIPTDEPPAQTRIDPVVDFNWELGRPVDEVGDDFYMIRWSGQLRAPMSGEFTFYVTADDGVRLWVDGQIIIDQWVPQATTEASGQIVLEGGQDYDLRLEYFEAGGLAEVHLEYATPVLSRTIIPTSQLYPNLLQRTHDQSTAKLTTKLYPNPTRESATLEVIAQAANPISWTFFDTQGRRCGHHQSAVVPGINRFSLAVDYLPAGLYCLEVQNAEGLISRSIFVVAD